MPIAVFVAINCNIPEKIIREIAGKAILLFFISGDILRVRAIGGYVFLSNYEKVLLFLVFFKKRKYF